MAKKDKKQYKLLSEEDMKIIKSDPVGLADYVVHNKTKEIRKTAIIVTLVCMAVSFGLGFMVGGNITKNSIPNNVVQIQLDKAVTTSEVEK